MTAYEQGRGDWAAGTVDTGRTADREYCAGIADERTAGLDRRLTAGDVAEPDLTIRQFCNEPGSEADLRGHWSVMRGDPHADKPQRQAEFVEHAAGCEVCRTFEATQTAAAVHTDVDEAV